MAITDDIFIGPTGLILLPELVRLIAQCLNDLGLSRSAATVEQESSIMIESAPVKSLRRQILDGEWDASVATLRNMPMRNRYIFVLSVSIILQQKFFDFLCHGHVMEALMTLQSEITPLDIKKETISELSLCLIMPSRMESLIITKERLFEVLQVLLPASVLLPERRLLRLLEQALIMQKKPCTFHNLWTSLLSDYGCGLDRIPDTTLQILEEHKDEVWCVQFSHNGAYLASGSKDGTVIIWEVVADGSVRFKRNLTGHTEPVAHVAWSPDDRMILTCGYGEFLVVWNVDSGSFISGVTNSFTACAWFPNGKRFVVNDAPSSFNMWSVEGKHLGGWSVSEYGAAPRLNDLTVTADGQYVIGIYKNNVFCLDLVTLSNYVLRSDGYLTSLYLSKDERFVLTNVLNDEVQLIEMGNTKRLRVRYRGHRQRRHGIRSCFGGLDQIFVVSGSEDSQVYIWLRDTGEILKVLPGHSGTVNCVTWNPVSLSMFASASDDYTIRIWGLSEQVAPRKCVH